MGEELSESEVLRNLLFGDNDLALNDELYFDINGLEVTFGAEIGGDGGAVLDLLLGTLVKPRSLDSLTKSLCDLFLWYLKFCFEIDTLN